jgi:SagB-type dehydrogenase family enzyme
MKKYILFLFILIFVKINFSENIKLDIVSDSINVDLIKAFEMRKSIRTFSDKAISKKQLSTILWCANGINRNDDKRTAPAAFDKYFINLYIADSKAVYLYNAKNNSLDLIKQKNIKNEIAKKNIANASHIIIATGKISKLPFYLKKTQKLQMAHANAGCILQNIYLITNALNLGTVMTGYIDSDKISKILNLSKNEIPLYIMPIGYKK